MTTKAARNRTISLDATEQKHYMRYIRRFSKALGTISEPNIVINGDAFLVLKKMPADTFDMLFADPPYNLTKRFGKEAFKQSTSDEYGSWLDSWIKTCVPLLKETASIYICGDWRSAGAIQRIGSKYFILQNRITWEREKGRGAKRNWKNTAEDVWFFTVSDRYTFNLDAVKQRRRVIAPYKAEGKPKDWVESVDGKFRDTHPSNIWTDITVPFWSMPENTDHPTQKPEKLMAKMILASTNAGDMILDPFAGSGTTAVAAKKLDRNFIAIESDEEYCRLAAQRLRLAETDKTIQGFADGVFWERNAGRTRK